MGRGLFPIVYEILGDRVISGFASDGGALIGNFLFSENPSSQEMIEFLFDDGSIEVATIRTLTDNTLTMLVDGEESKWHFTHAS
ncbi:MAG: hypothetical protein FWE19_06900 [Oscillospiraceae bacterium]|nr:hypothetical protein [Oscillospiraceae bacterium]